MTISKERLNEIALEIATEIYGPFNFISQRLNLNDFAIALIRRVVEECEIGGFSVKTIQLPLVSEE